MTVRVLGVDLASGRWRDNGTALLSFDDDSWRDADAGVVGWPADGRPDPARIVSRIDQFCLAHEVSAVSLDGPQGWRDPDLPPGWGRASERESHTPGKTGPPGTCVPGPALAWIKLSIEVFERLRALEHVQLANEVVERIDRPEPGRYVVLECFPTSTWKTARLAKLPSKARTRDTTTFARALAEAFGLPPLGPIGHDDLQAVVAALPAAALLGGPARAVARGRPGRRAGRDWIEGLIWDAEPLGVTSQARTPREPLLVVVTGPPASGKTTLAERLARELALPLVAKDAIKERLYDELGSGDREWSRRLGRATYALLFDWVGRLLAAGQAVIVEANFTSPAAERFAGLPPHRTLQLFCTAPREVVIERYAARRRHDGHLDAVVLDELRAGLHEEQWEPLPLSGEIQRFEVGNGDVEAIVNRVRGMLVLA